MMQPDPTASALLNVGLKRRHRFGRPPVWDEIQLEHHFVIREELFGDRHGIGYIVDFKAILFPAFREPRPSRLCKFNVMASSLCEREHFEFAERGRFRRSEEVL